MNEINKKKFKLEKKNQESVDQIDKCPDLMLKNFYSFITVKSKPHSLLRLVQLRQLSVVQIIPK
jgi:hypothetical protein